MGTNHSTATPVRRGDASPQLLKSLGFSEKKRRGLSRRPPRRTNVSPVKTTAYVSTAVNQDTMVVQCEMVLAEYYRIIRQGRGNRARYYQLASSVFFTCGSFYLPRTSLVTLQSLQDERMSFRDNLRYTITDKPLDRALRIQGVSPGTLTLGDIHSFIHLVFMSYNQPFQTQEITEELITELINRVMDFEGRNIFDDSPRLSELLDLLLQEQIFLDSLADVAQGFRSFSKHIVKGLSLAFQHDWPEYAIRGKNMMELMMLCQWERHEDVGGPDFSLRKLAQFMPYRFEALRLMDLQTDLIRRVRLRSPETELPAAVLLAIGRFCGPELGVLQASAHPSRYPRLWELLKILYVAQGIQPGPWEDTYKMMCRSLAQRDLRSSDVQLYQDYRDYCRRQDHDYSRGPQQQLFRMSS